MKLLWLLQLFFAYVLSKICRFSVSTNLCASCALPKTRSPFKGFYHFRLISSN